MKVGKEITQEQSDQLRQDIISHMTTTQGNTPAGSEALNLFTGMSTTLWNTILEALMARAVAWIQDPANIQMIIAKVFELLTPKKS